MLKRITRAGHRDCSLTGKNILVLCRLIDQQLFQKVKVCSDQQAAGELYQRVQNGRDHCKHEM